MLLMGSKDAEQDYQDSLSYLKELIAFHEKHGRIIWFPPFVEGNAIIARKGDDITGEAFDGFLDKLKSLKEDTINRIRS